MSSSTCIDALFMAVAHCEVMNTIAVSWGFTFAVVGDVLKNCCGGGVMYARYFEVLMSLLFGVI